MRSADGRTSDSTRTAGADLVSDSGRDVSRAQDLIDVGELTISSRRDAQTHTIGLVGELDLATIDGVHRELARVEATDASAIIIDLSGLTFIDSSGVQLLYLAHTRHAGNDRFSLLRGPAAVQRVFELSGLQQLLPFAD